MLKNIVEKVPLWSVTIWDKNFSGVDKTWQPKTIKYKYLLSDELDQLNVGGNVRLLYTGKDVGFTTEELAGDAICNGEIVSIPWGGTPSVKYYNGKFVTGDNRIATSNDTNKLLNKYLYYYLQGHIHEITSYYRGAGLKHPAMKDVLKMKISFPSISEQNEVIKQFESMENVISLRQQELRKFDNLIKARFVELFGDIKDSVNITEIAHTYIGLVTTMTTHYCNEGTPLLFNSSIKADKIVWDGTYLDSEFSEKNKSRMHKTNDIITVHTGDIGTSAVIGEDLNGSLGFATIVTRINDINKYNPRYISSFLNYGSGKEQLSKYSRDVRNNLNLKDYNRLMVPNASIFAQNEYADFVKQVDKSKVAVQKALDEAQLLFDSLMQKYFG